MDVDEDETKKRSRQFLNETKYYGLYTRIPDVTMDVVESKSNSLRKRRRTEIVTVTAPENNQIQNVLTAAPAETNSAEDEFYQVFNPYCCAFEDDLKMLKRVLPSLQLNEQIAGKVLILTPQVVLERYATMTETDNLIPTFLSAWTKTVNNDGSTLEEIIVVDVVEAFLEGIGKKVAEVLPVLRETLFGGHVLEKKYFNANYLYSRFPLFKKEKHNKLQEADVKNYFQSLKECNPNQQLTIKADNDSFITLVLPHLLPMVMYKSGGRSATGDSLWLSPPKHSPLLSFSKENYPEYTMVNQWKQNPSGTGKNALGKARLIPEITKSLIYKCPGTKFTLVILHLGDVSDSLLNTENSTATYETIDQVRKLSTLYLPPRTRIGYNKKATNKRKRSGPPVNITLDGDTDVLIICKDGVHKLIGQQNFDVLFDPIMQRLRDDLSSRKSSRE
eukprot:TRINITY_DN12657_c0_g1_i1.p1 TRINITY_DN12657_c0_g1~~TRINITY_DN12657_c0_g1_i1.p1  ORF type:complete len:446 (+),score=54.54 TRINITY_DN12657_c0_g1_i1:314-1651(+)